MEALPDIPDSLRPGLAELQAYLVGEPPERLADHVLVLASTWCLAAAGLDLDRLAQDARTFRQLTPEHDRVLASFPDAVASYLVYRMMTNDEEELEPAVAAERLGKVRAALELRATWVEADYPLIAEGFRRLLAETAGGTPPYDRIWHALARRLGDPGLPDWQVRAGG
ncbi:MAG TPA: hypothetical protein VH063_09285 [Gaiellaceae bacterium]|jgi:hypothetical protein|nr:hypothetical protein [Gaiellaceae bacterium]